MIRMLLITLLSLLQTVTGSYLVYGIVQLNRGGAAAEQVGGIGNLIFVAVILAGLGFLVSKLRNFDVFIIVGVLLEVLLSPVAFPRVVLSWIFCMIFKVQIEPEMEGTHTGDYIVLNGTPEVNMSIRPEVDGGIGTIAMVVNMIPHVINARPGLKTMLDLPVPRAIMGDFRDYIEK